MRGERLIKIILFTSFIAVISLPLIQKIIEFKKVDPLHGDIQLNEKKDWSAKSWFSGEFQENYEKYINDHIGFRPYFVRLRNQIAYSVFDSITAKTVIRGKENYLYELYYFKAYNGTDFIGADSILSKVRNIKLLQDTLQVRGKSLIVCLAPGKGSFYPEYFPDEYVKPKTDSTNYKFYRKYLKEQGVNYIDFNRWFLEMKDTSGCSLYPKYGIHWSFYGMLLSADSLIRYIENLRHINMTDLHIYNIRKTKKIHENDYDIAAGMNLLFRLKSEPMCLPEYEWISTGNEVKPKVIIVSDSYYWSMFNIGLSTNSFGLGGFWYYNTQIFPDSYKEPLYMHQIDVKKRIEDSDVIILMSTEANLSNFAWGFIGNALKLYGQEE